MADPTDADVVLLYGPPWRSVTRVSKHHLAAYLAGRGRRVLYVEAPLGPLTLLRRGRAALPEVRDALRPPWEAAPGVWVRRYINPIPYHSVTPLTRHRAANRLGQRLIAPRLRRDLAALGMGRPLVIAGLPHAFDLLPGLGPRAGLVYHCADEYATVRGFPASLPALEADLCRAADLVVTTGETLCRERRHLNPRTFWVPNGVEVDRFASPPAPATEITVLGGPVVGFVGAVADWVDVPLLADLARRRPAWRVVLVGPIGRDVGPLRGLTNVHLLGPRPYDDLPGLLAAMDVALVPFEERGIALHADPIKVYEYLASGAPVVATNLPGLRRLAHVIRLASGTDAFLGAVDAALAEGRDAGAQARRAEARQHDWRARFERFEALLAEHLPR